MTDLIRVLEKGPGSRELSDRVLLALGYEHWGSAPTKAWGLWGPDKNSDPVFGFSQLGSFSPTTSIDDALALVPDEGEIELVYLKHQNGQSSAAYGTATSLDQVFWPASTPALAICIAILKAKETE